MISAPSRDPAATALARLSIEAASDSAAACPLELDSRLRHYERVMAVQRDTVAADTGLLEQALLQGGRGGAAGARARGRGARREDAIGSSDACPAYPASSRPRPVPGSPGRTPSQRLDTLQRDLLDVAWNGSLRQAQGSPGARGGSRPRSPGSRSQAGRDEARDYSRSTGTAPGGREEARDYFVQGGGRPKVRAWAGGSRSPSPSRSPPSPPSYPVVHRQPWRGTSRTQLPPPPWAPPPPPYVPLPSKASPGRKSRSPSPGSRGGQQLVERWSVDGGDHTSTRITPERPGSAGSSSLEAGGGAQQVGSSRQAPWGGLVGSYSLSWDEGEGTGRPRSGGSSKSPSSAMRSLTPLLAATGSSGSSATAGAAAGRGPDSAFNLGLNLAQVELALLRLGKEAQEAGKGRGVGGGAGAGRVLDSAAVVAQIQWQLHAAWQVQG